MKKAVFAFVVLAAILAFSENSNSQDLDTLYLPTMHCAPGDTVVMALHLRNQSFRVGGISSKILLPDSALANFIFSQRGSAVEDFAVFVNQFSSGTLSLAGIANMPNFDPIPPLPLGYHEIAIFKISISESTPPGTSLAVEFDQSGPLTNAISDSSGYLLSAPFVIDGEIIIDSEQGIDEPDGLPTEFALIGNYPNPFNASTTIQFEIAKPGTAQLRVYDLLGQLVGTIFDSYCEPGVYTITWNGRAADGRAVASGIYLYRLYYEGKIATRKMSLLK
jgi:hypothetical protein